MSSSKTVVSVQDGIFVSTDGAGRFERRATPDEELLWAEIVRLRADAEHVERYWQQFEHYPKGSPDEKNDGSEVEDRPNPERSGSKATHNAATDSGDAGDKSPARSALTEAEQLLSAWADILPPNGHLYFEHTKRAREYFERRSSETSAGHHLPLREGLTKSNVKPAAPGSSRPTAPPPAPKSPNLAETAAVHPDTARLDWLDSQRKWGDCFAVCDLDSGDVYVRPWQYKNQSGDYAARLVSQTIREVIDAERRRAVNGNDERGA